MANRIVSVALGLLMVVMLAAGCSSKKARPDGVAGFMSSGGSIVRIDASRYNFSPNSVSVEKPGLLAVEIANRSGSSNNFTLKDPGGKVIKSVDVPAHGTVISNIELEHAGTYTFYSNKMLRASLGAKGRIIVGPPKQ
ncbi:MAG: hypothetical protein LLG06_14375 [Desulfobacteraceae bacterium]|nr:hypothetical protein [Desulfobacteraceae bacterium]